MTEPFETTFILFADMLGFADLVERQGDEMNELNPVFTNIELYSPSQADSLLGYRFINFHRCLNKAREYLQEIGAGTGIVFSDSAFFRLDRIDHAISFARSLMFNMLTSEVPVRMGLARGSYRMLRFMTDSSLNVLFHMSQFLGTGVVRAYQAERCGLPGLRVFMHPSVEPFLEQQEMLIIPVRQNDRMRLDVRFEINYLDSSPSSIGPDYDDCLQYDSLRWMMGLAKEDYQNHYIETYRSMNVMRGQLGRPEYPWDKFLNRDEYDHKNGIR